MRAEIDQTLMVVDALVMHTSPTTAFRLGEKHRDPIQMYLSDIFTTPPSLTGHPALSVPAGQIDGLPVGAQIVTRHQDEPTALRLGMAIHGRCVVTKPSRPPPLQQSSHGLWSQLSQQQDCMRHPVPQSPWGSNWPMYFEAARYFWDPSAARRMASTDVSAAGHDGSRGGHVQAAHWIAQASMVVVVFASGWLARMCVAGGAMLATLLAAAGRRRGCDVDNIIHLGRRCSHSPLP